MSTTDGSLRRLFWRVLFRQLEVLLAGTLLLTWVWDGGRGLVFFCGGMIAVLAQTLMGIRGLLRADGRSAGHLAASFFRGEAGKWLATLVLLALAFKLRPEWRIPANAGLLFLGLAVVQLLSWWWIAWQEVRVARLETPHQKQD